MVRFLRLDYFPARKRSAWPRAVNEKMRAARKMSTPIVPYTTTTFCVCSITRPPTKGAQRNSRPRQYVDDALHAAQQPTGHDRLPEAVAVDLKENHEPPYRGQSSRATQYQRVDARSTMRAPP